MIIIKLFAALGTELWIRVEIDWIRWGKKPISGSSRKNRIQPEEKNREVPICGNLDLTLFTLNPDPALNRKQKGWIRIRINSYLVHPG